MTTSTGFWNQPSKAHRNFQIVFTILTLNFTLPALSYTFMPGQALDAFLQVNSLLGGVTYPFDETNSALWRILAAANVATLAFMCLLLQLNLRRWYPVLAPLLFLKGYSTVTLAGLYVLNPDVPLFLAGALLDGVTWSAIYFFATRAHADTGSRPADELVPRPRAG